MVAKLCAVWFVLLSVLPFTAPFSAIEVTDFVLSHSAVDDLGLTVRASQSVADDPAMVSDRSAFFFRSRLCAVVRSPSYDAIPTVPLFLPPIALPIFVANLPPATTVLQI